jgi:hypothetical protein
MPRPRLSNIATGLSLALCASFTVLWLRSYWRVDELTFTTASYPYSQSATDDVGAGVAIFQAHIVQRILSTNRGCLQFATRRSVGDFDLTGETCRNGVRTIHRAHAVSLKATMSSFR